MAAKKSFKKDKFEERLLNEINQMLRSQFSDSRLTFVSITGVELNPDYSVAKVSWDTFDSARRGDIKKAINSISSRLRVMLAGTLKVRHMPHLVFEYDSRFDDERGVEEILESEAKLGKGF